MQEGEASGVLDLVLPTSDSAQRGWIAPLLWQLRRDGFSLFHVSPWNPKPSSLADRDLEPRLLPWDIHVTQRGSDPSHSNGPHNVTYQYLLNAEL